MTKDRRVALVTGGRRGIGLGVAKALAAQGFDLAINGVSPESGAAEAIAELKALGADAAYVRGDVADLDDHARMVEAVRARFGRLDLLVNNAGIGPRSRDDVLVATPDNYDHVMATNLRGPYFLTQRVAGWMVEQKKADPAFEAMIVFVTSISSTVVSVNRGEYCISKAGLSMAAQLYAVRLAEFGIPVHEVRPGVIATDMTAKVKDKYDRMFAEGLALVPRWGTPEDIGRVVAALARGDLAYSTGQVILADGGMQIRTL